MNEESLQSLLSSLRSIPESKPTVEEKKQSHKGVKVVAVKEKERIVNEVKKEVVKKEAKENQSAVVAFNTTYTINGKTHFITVSRNAAMKDMTLAITKKTGRCSTMADDTKEKNVVTCSFDGVMYHLNMKPGTIQDIRAVLARVLSLQFVSYH